QSEETKALPEPLPINPPESALPPPPVETVADAEVEKPKRGTTRAKSSKSTPKDPAPPEVQTQAPAPVARTPIRTLYLDCYPLAENVVHAETLFLTAQERIQRDHGVPDYRLIDFKGAGIFASTLGAIVDSSSPGVGCRSRHPNAGRCARQECTR